MADLTSKQINNTYKRLMQLAGTGQVTFCGTASSGTYITDGEGNTSSLSLSQARVGIGTAAPATKFHVEDNTDITTTVKSSSGGATLKLDRSAADKDSNILFTQAGTTKWSIGSTDSDNAGDGTEFYIGTAVNAPKLWIEAGGNVGIGVTDPDSQLEVYGTSTQLKLSYDGSNSSSFTVSSGGDLTVAPSGGDTTVTGTLSVSGAITLGGTIDINTASISTEGQDVTVELYQSTHAFNFDGNQDNILSIDGFYNKVGFGTAIPSTRVHIQEPDNEDVVLTIDTLGTKDSYIDLITDSDGTPKQGAIGFDYSTDNIRIVHGSTFSSSVNGITISSTGKVGIQRDAPSYDLQVGENDADTAIGVSDFGRLGYTEVSNLIGLYSEGSLNIEVNDNNAHAGSYCSWLVNGSEKMRMIADGKFGIGVSDPDAMLEVFHGGTTGIKVSYDGTKYGTINSNSSGDLVLEGQGGIVETTGELFVGTMAAPHLDTSVRGKIAVETNTGSKYCLSLWHGHASTPLGLGIFYEENVSNTGDPYITCSTNSGTSSTVKWQVRSDGTMKSLGTYSHNLTGSYRDVFVKDDGVIGYVTSSKRYKGNISEMDDVSWIYDLKPKSFEYKKVEEDGTISEELDGIKKYGLIAEEVEEVASFLCSYNEDGKTVETVNYSELIPILLKSIQDLKAEVDLLKNK